MKNLIKFTLIWFLTVSLSSCEKDESKEPRPLFVDGQYVRIDFTDNRVLDFDNINNTFFGGLITTPGNNVRKFEITVKRRNGGVWGADFAKIPLEINVFPYELKITPQLLATSLNLPISDLKSNDFYLFRCSSTGLDGRIVTYNDLSAVIKNQSSMKQAYLFVTQFFAGTNYLNKKDTYYNFDTSILLN